MSASQPTIVTILMPIRNEAAFIERSLGAVLAQDYPADLLEVLVIDGMSNDGTREIVTKMLSSRINARLLDNPGRIVPTALNIGLAEAAGDVIVRVDGHTLIAEDYVTRCVEALDASGAQCVGGPMRAVGETAFGEAVALATSHPFGVGGSRFHYATEPVEVDTVYMGTWPCQVFSQVGCFDEEMVRNQDDEFSYRLGAAGGRIWLDPRIRSTYYTRPTFRSLWRQYYQYGYWKVRVFQKVPGSARPRHWAPPLFALGVVGGLLVAALIPGLRLAYLVGLLVYLVLSLSISVRIAVRAGRHLILCLPVVFATLHLAYGLGFWSGILRFGLPSHRVGRNAPSG